MQRPSELCHLFTSWRGEMPEGGWIVTEKIDGWRHIWKDGQQWTRQGMAFHGADHVKPVLRLMELASGQRLFLDGEFQVADSLAETKAHCERGWKDAPRRGVLHLFDAVPAGDWYRNDCQMTLLQRLDWLGRIMAAAKAHPLSWEIDPVIWAAVRIVPGTWMDHAADVQDEARRIWSAGGEGLVLKKPHSLYRRGRTDEWRKVKK